MHTRTAALRGLVARFPLGILGDAAAAACVLIAGLVPGLGGFGGGAPRMPVPPGALPEQPSVQWFFLLPILVSAGAMFLRRSIPLVALMITVFLFVITAGTGVPSLGPGVGLAIAAYGFAYRFDRRTALLVGGAIAGFLLVLSLLEADWAAFEPRLLQQAAAVAVAAALGDGARSRGEALTALTERAERAERTREAEAERRVTEERLRIARDLHDTVAHQISVISLNAGAASRALPERPDRAEGALAAIRQASRDVLTEIGVLLRFLRSSEASGEQAPVRPPSRGLAELEDLIEEVRASGFPVAVTRPADFPQLATTTADTAFRVVQEGLTNARRHGAGRATIGIETSEEELVIRISNPLGPAGTDAPSVRPGSPPDEHGPGAGFGLIGLRERVAALGGSVATARIGHGFRLEARLPLGEAARA